VLLALTFLTFLVGHLAPGDPILILMGTRRDPVVYQRLREEYGLNQPLLQQYLGYLANLLRGNLGMSFYYEGRPVHELLAQGVPISVGLGGLALLFSLLVGVPLGVLAAIRHGSLLDRGIIGGTLVLYAVPSFVLIPIAWSINLALYRAGYPSLPQAGWGQPEHLVLPVLVLAATNIGYLARLCRAAVLDALGNDYVRTAHAKGLHQHTVALRHVLRSALLPLITLLGPASALLVTGTFVVENLFNIPGIGRIAVDAVGRRDYPVIQGTTVLLGTAVVVMNAVADVLYRLSDPRIAGIEQG